MDPCKQIDWFNTNIKFFKLLGVWPTNSGEYYRYYALFFIIFFIIIYNFCFTINFLFLPRVLEIFIDDMMLHGTCIVVISKAFTFYLSHDKIIDILSILENNLFQDDSEDAKKIIVAAKKLNIKYWKINMAFSLIANGTHISIPLLTHLITGVELELPVFSCDFIPKNIKNVKMYPMYFYQALGMHIHMWYNLNIDSFFLGLMLFIIAQLDILDYKLRKVTKGETSNDILDEEAINKLNHSIKHFNELAKLCSLVQDVFSVSLFVQFGAASIILCVCLFRFTLPAPIAYYVYMVTYIIVMMVQRAVFCWYGTQIINKSSRLAHSIYDCDWTPRSRRFKSSMRLFVERVNRPLSITGGKIVLLSMETFSSIMNSAYSFYTLLKHMQSLED